MSISKNSLRRVNANAGAKAMMNPLATSSASIENVHYLALDKLKADEALDSAHCSAYETIINKWGLIESFIVRDMQDGSFEVLSDHHRYHAAINLGITQVPCQVISDITDAEASSLKKVLRNTILPNTDTIHDQKFKVVRSFKDNDMPAHLL